MRLVVLGSGSSVPHPSRAASGFWLQTGSGTLLLDAGADAAHRLAAEKLPWTELDAIWISHFHLDHVGGLAPYLFGTKYAPQTQARTKPLTVIGPAGLKNVIANFDAAYDYGLLHQPFPIHVREVAPEETFEMLPEIEARTFSTPHTPESLAVRLTIPPQATSSDDESGEATVFCYTSDTGNTDELIRFAADAHLLIIEASFREQKPVETHLNLREAVEIAKQANVGAATFTHLYPEWDNVNLEDEAAKIWNGVAIEARDGLQIHFDARSSEVKQPVEERQ